MIKVYEKTAAFCPQCMATKRWLDDRGHAYELYPVEEHPEVVEAAKARGVTSAPIVVVSDDRHPADDIVFGGFDDDALQRHIGGEKIAK